MKPYHLTPYLDSHKKTKQMEHLKSYCDTLIRNGGLIKVSVWIRMDLNVEKGNGAIFSEIQRKKSCKFGLDGIRAFK